MLVCVSAATLPSVMVATETIISSEGQSTVLDRSQLPAPALDRPPKKKRVITAKPAALGATDRKAVTGVGAPWYTSGHQKWNGTDAVLKPKPANTSSAARESGQRVGSRQP